MVNTGVILGRPRIGIPHDIVYEVELSLSNFPRGGDYEILIPELYKLYPNIVGFWDTSKTLWVWAECSQRWWKLLEDEIEIKINPDRLTPFADYRGGSPTGRIEYRDLGFKIIGQRNTTGAQYVPTGRDSRVLRDRIVPLDDLGISKYIVTGWKWTTWDARRGEWVTKYDFCDWQDEEIPQPEVPEVPEEEFPTGKVFTQIEDDDILPVHRVMVTKGLWDKNRSGELLNFFLGNEESGSEYRLNVYGAEVDTCDSHYEFAIAYGNRFGSGSVDKGGLDYLTPSKAVYGQYRLFCLSYTQETFKIGEYVIDDFYAINVSAKNIGVSIDVGTFELNLAHLSGSEFVAGGGDPNAYTGSAITLSGNGKVLRLIDDSRLDYDQLDTQALSGSYSYVLNGKFPLILGEENVRYIVSGTLERGIYSPTNPHVYGLLFPKRGVVILDAQKLDMSASFGTVRGVETDGDNMRRLFLSISGAADFTDASGDPMGFKGRAVVESWQRGFFIRIRNRDYNFSNNPTFSSGSEYYVRDEFYGNPITYPTTIGLFNDRYEMVAVGKISMPIRKSFVDESLFVLKLEL